MVDSGIAFRNRFVQGAAPSVEVPVWQHSLSGAPCKASRVPGSHNGGNGGVRPIVSSAVPTI